MGEFGVPGKLSDVSVTELDDTKDEVWMDMLFMFFCIDATLSLIITDYDTIVHQNMHHLFIFMVIFCTEKLPDLSLFLFLFSKRSFFYRKTIDFS